MPTNHVCTKPLLCRVGHCMQNAWSVFHFHFFFYYRIYRFLLFYQVWDNFGYFWNLSVQPVNSVQLLTFHEVNII